MTFSGRKLFEFGPYRLDQLKRQLWCDGRVVPLTAKAMEILVLLVVRGGEVLSRRELIEAIWPDAYVEEANLTQNVFILRKALGETAHDHNYIVTVPGRGYRFASEVREIAPGNGGMDSAATVGATPSLFSVAADTERDTEIAGSGSAPGSPIVVSEAPIPISPTEAFGSPPGVAPKLALDLDDWLCAEEEITQPKSGTVAACSHAEVSVDVRKPGAAATHDCGGWKYLARHKWYRRS